MGFLHNQQEGGGFDPRLFRQKMEEKTAPLFSAIQQPIYPAVKEELEKWGELSGGDVGAAALQYSLLGAIMENFASPVTGTTIADEFPGVRELLEREVPGRAKLAGFLGGLAEPGPSEIGPLLGTLAFIPAKLAAKKTAEEAGEKIAGLAIRLKDGSVLAGPHPNYASIADEASERGLARLESLTGSKLDPGNSYGYITTSGRFVDDVDALPIAIKGGQATSQGAGLDYLHPFDLEFPLPWHEWNQGRNLNRIMTEISLDPDDMKYIGAGGRELTQALESSPTVTKIPGQYSIDDFLSNIVDLRGSSSNVSPAANAGFYSSLVRAKNELINRALIQGDEDALRHLSSIFIMGEANPFDVSMDMLSTLETLPRMVNQNLSDAQLFSAAAEILMRSGR